jgi:hypothetical protein
VTKQNGKRPNATKHGIFSQQAVLPGEDPEEFLALCADLVAEWSPTGRTEEDAVLSIADAMWRKRRLRNFRSFSVARNSLDPKHPSYDEFSGLEVFAFALRADPEEAFEELGERCLKPGMLMSLRQKFPRADFPSPAEWTQAVIDDIEKQLLAEEILRQHPAHERYRSMIRTAATFTDEVVDKELKLDERLDAMIERAVKRLVQTKSFKQMLSQTGTERTPERSESGKVLKLPVRK